MGTLINRRVFKQLSDSLTQALFILPDAKSIPSGAVRLNVGLRLSESLYSLPAAMRAAKLEERFFMLMPQDIDVELCRIDMLFDPVWHLNALRLFLAAGRNKRLYVVWPGKMNENILIYSQPGNADYAVYDVKSYIDTYVISK